MLDDVSIRQLEATDWPHVRAIYLRGIATGQATFETTAPTWEAWAAAHLEFARVVALSDGELCGWAALSPVSKRAAYAGVAEVSVYVAEEFRKRGIGLKLLQRLIAESEQHGIWTLQASVFPENAATVALHQRCGFREVGRRERIGRLNGVWRDTMLLERRSQVVGSE
jgi:phosphinothricin acetyltransferase